MECLAVLWWKCVLIIGRTKDDFFSLWGGGDKAVAVRFGDRVMVRVLFLCAISRHQRKDS